MNGRTLNPLGSDALALADVIAPSMTGALTSIAEWVGYVVAAISVALLAAVIWAVQIDFEVVAVTPGGALIPLIQLDKDNEQALRARLAANAPAGQEQPSPASTAAAVVPNTITAGKPATSNATTRSRAIKE